MIRQNNITHIYIHYIARFRVEKGRWSFYHKRKISSLITFPIDGLDISPYVITALGISLLCARLLGVRTFN